jgi:malonyl CoA-acyl carrier protein transacylase
VKSFRRTELVVLTAADQQALAERARRAAETARETQDRTLRGLIAEVGDLRPEGPLATAIVADSTAELAKKLLHAADRLADPVCRRINDRSGIFFSADPLRAAGGKVALLFPGEGSQYQGMLADLCRRLPPAREAFDRIDRAFEGHPRGFLPSQLVFGGMDPDRLWEMDCAIEVVFTANTALHAVLEALALKPDVIVGHSTGDYSALFASGAIRIRDESELASLMLGLNHLYQDLSRDDTVPETPLMAVGAVDRKDIEQVLAEVGSIELAMDNCPHQAVLSGSADALAAARDRLAGRGAMLEELAFKRGYHTAAFRPALTVLQPFFDTLPLQAPQVPMWSCASASPVPEDLDAFRSLTLEQWAMPVRFRETVERLWENGVRIFVESGPRGNLTAFIKDILRGRPHLAVACDGVHRPTVTHLQFALGQLAANGVPLDLSLLAGPDIQLPPTRSVESSAERRPARRGPVLTLATGWPEMRLSETTAARLAAAPSGTEVTPERVQAPPPTGAERVPAADQPPLGGRGAIMAAHFEVTNRLLEAQEKVLAGFLASRTGRPAPPQPKSYPLLGPRVSRKAGVLTAAVALSTARLPFLAHHTLGGRVSQNDGGLTALPVMPLTMTLELAAEAALELVPDHVCTGFENVLAQRWITLDSDGLAEVTVTARLRQGSGPNTIASVEIGGAAGRDGGRPHLTADVVLATSYPPAPPGRAIAACDRPRWDRERIYREAMFHGPLFRGIEQVTRLDEHGAEAVLEVLPRVGMVTGVEPTFATDPVLLDQPGQVVGVWTADRLASGFVIFPTRIQRLELFSPPPPPGQRMGCGADIRLDGETGVVSDLEVSDGAGRLHARFTGWEDRRFDVPPSFLAFMLDPVGSSLCRPGAPAAAGARIARPDLPPGFAARGGIWQQVLAGLTLARGERREFSGSALSAESGEQWLLTRLAAKDAARRWLARHGLTIAPADVMIAGNGGGRLQATGLWRTAVGGDLTVDVSYSNGEAVAEAHAGTGEGKR